MKKAIVYKRKSTDESGNQILSLQTQERKTNELVLAHGLTVTYSYEEKRSAKISGNRPLFTKMLSQIRDGEAEYIVVAHADRLSRNEREMADIIDLVQDGFLKGIVLTKERIHATVDDIHELARDLVEASHFSRRLSERVKEGNETKLLRGEYCTKAPIGYLNRDAKIYPDPKYSDYVKLLFNLYSTGEYSLKQLTNLLWERGMRTRKAGGKIQKSVVHKILVNPVYYGSILVNKRHYPGMHVPLVSKELFDQAQDVLHGKNIPKFQKHDFAFHGYLVCGECGCSFTTTIKKGKHIYHYCTNAKGFCSQHFRYLTDSQVQVLLGDLLLPFSSLEEDVAQLAYETYTNDLGNSITSGNKTRELVLLQVQEADRKLDQLLDLLLSKKIDEVTYDKKKLEIQNQKAQLQTILNQTKPSNPVLSKDALERFKKRGISIYQMFQEGDEEVRRDLLKSALWNAKVINGKITSQRYKLPWAYVEKAAKSGNFKDWYPVGDSNPRFSG